VFYCGAMPQEGEGAMPDPTPDPTSDPAPEPAPDPKPNPTPAPDPTPKSDPEGLGDAGKEALKRERAARADAQKQLKEAEDKLKEIADKDKTEVERATERAAEAEKRANDAEAKQLRIEIAIKKKLPVDMAHRLVGDDQESLEKDADKLLKSVAPVSGGLDQGARGGGGKPKSMNDVLRSALTGQ
jgi:hypothetical protein